MITRLFFIIILVQFFPLLHAEETIQEIDGIVVTATRSPQAFSDLTRQVTVIEATEIEQLPATGLADILAGALSVDIRNRGSFGVQADLSMRGSTFEQTIVLINGVRISDPQTGHHNLDIPINKYSIERIEILNGAGSKLYGPNAMGGVINIITKKDQPSQILAEISAGDFGLTELTAGLNGSPFGNINISRQHSDGFIYDTDFDIINISANKTIDLNSNRLNINAGYSDKRFGAYRFYTGYYPEWEETETEYLITSYDYHRNKFSISSKLLWRRHDDRFILDRTNKEYYQNITRTDQVGLELTASQEIDNIVLTLGAEWGYEEIDGRGIFNGNPTNGLGDHTRHRVGFLFESQIKLSRKLNLVPGFTLFKYTDYDWQFIPGLDIGYDLSDVLRIYGSASRAFRIPTYTDLYNPSSANHGNPELEPEKSTGYEIGYNYNYRAFRVDGAFFYRDGNNMIDWLQPDDDTLAPWQAENVNQIKTAGLELSSSLRLNRSFVNRIGVQYSYISSEFELVESYDNYRSKYALGHLRHLLQGLMMINLGHNIDLVTKWKYAQRVTDEEYNTVDCKLNWRSGHFDLFVEISNIFSFQYSETGLSPLPGRWFKIGLKVETPI